MQRVSPREDSPLRTLRRQPGNGAIRRLVKRGVGPTLNIDDLSDRYEHEADRVATQVMHGRERAAKTEAVGADGDGPAVLPRPPVRTVQSAGRVRKRHADEVH